MPDQLGREVDASTKAPKQSLRNAIEQMDVPEIMTLIDFAEQTLRRKQEAARDELLAEFRQRASDLGLSLESLVATPPALPAKPHAVGKKLPAKYRGPNGEEWTGRGRLPAWLAVLEAEGKGREHFATKPSDNPSAI